MGAELSTSNPGDAGSDDHDLVVAAQQGSRSAVDTLVRRHDRWVRHVVYAAVGNAFAVDDIVQQVWTTIWQQIGTLMDPARWRSWVYRTAKNAAIDAGMKNSRERKKRKEFEGREWTDAAETPVLRLARCEEHQRMLDAIKGLPEIYREPFMMRHLEDWSYVQISEALSLPIDTVETRLVRARRLLRSALQGNGGLER
jgi:RNA polymerase sigma-70 factor (ECF subfamily)